MALGRQRDPARERAAGTFARLDGLRKDATKPVAFRMDPRDVARLQEVADRKGIRLAQLVKMWVTERLNEESVSPK